MNRNPIVSVIIPTFNNDATIVQAIQSAINQTFIDCEIIVVDDGSTDSTRSLVTPFIDTGKIIYLYQKNAGSGAARNAGINSARGEYVAFLDADDYWHPEKIAKQVTIFIQNQNAIVCSTEAVTVDELEHINPIYRTAIDRPRTGWVLCHFIFHNIVTLSSAMVKTSVLREIGGFVKDRSLMRVEDYDLWLRLAARGMFCLVPETLTYYRTRANVSASDKISNHKKIMKVFARCAKLAPLRFKLVYAFGWFLHAVSLVGTYPLHVLRNVGIKGVMKELRRRFWLRMDFIFYPIVIAKLKKLGSASDISIDALLDFAYYKTYGVLVLGQIRSEIKPFLDIARGVEPRRILEIGTANGGNLFLLSKISAPDATVISIDLPGGDFGGGYFAMKQSVYKNFVDTSRKMFLIRDDSHKQSSLDRVKEILNSEKLDLLFIDADHGYAGVKSDFEMYGPLVRPGGIIGFHDIANPPDHTFGVQKFWNEIKGQYDFREIIDNPNQKGYGIGILYIK